MSLAVSHRLKIVGVGIELIVAVGVAFALRQTVVAHDVIIVAAIDVVTTDARLPIEALCTAAGVAVVGDVVVGVGAVAVAAAAAEVVHLFV